jgi:hypothetical protein
LSGSSFWVRGCGLALHDHGGGEVDAGGVAAHVGVAVAVGGDAPGVVVARAAQVGGVADDGVDDQGARGVVGADLEGGGVVGAGHQADRHRLGRQAAGGGLVGRRRLLDDGAAGGLEGQVVAGVGALGLDPLPGDLDGGGVGAGGQVEGVLELVGAVAAEDEVDAGAPPAWRLLGGFSGREGACGFGESVAEALSVPASCKCSREIGIIQPNGEPPYRRL